jgi:hypothetical protein
MGRCGCDPAAALAEEEESRWPVRALWSHAQSVCLYLRRLRGEEACQSRLQSVASWWSGRPTEDGAAMTDLLIPVMKAVAVLGIVYGALNIWELCRTGHCEMKDWL